MKGNLLIASVTILDSCLHTPMYFFLRHLSIFNLCLNFILFESSEYFVFTAMSFDRYTAICLPLRYDIILERGTCGEMAAASWLRGGLIRILISASTFSMSFCRPNIVADFFCDVPCLLKISCSEDYVAIDVSMEMFIITSMPYERYVAICCLLGYETVMNQGACGKITCSEKHIAIDATMPAMEGRAIFFSTCVPHLVVVTLFLSAGVFVYNKPPSNSSLIVDLLVSVFCTLVPPVMNPLVYNLRNQDMKAVMSRILKRVTHPASAM
ncbi:olfactory receptor 14A16-like [Tachyglossus aculeatus]|uniref:olfactory receptor 14A16-like n=1 Tax=Tachyglossus aculeatus TaxID=9261 RepID=UPI0018F46DD0|nr:olfactory receptor 14A16-like [Tachyglossus aculeatus]